MMPLLRYAFVRSSREPLLYSVLFGPAVLLISPILVTAIHLVLTGAAAYPVSIQGLTPEGNARLMGQLGRILCALSASAASFAIFRQEMADRSLGFFLLAVRSRAVVAAAIVYGVLTSLCALLVLHLGVGALTTYWAPYTPALAATLLISTLASAALGTVVVSISPEPSMLVAATAGSLTLVMLLEEWPSAAALLFVLLTGLTLILVASTILRRRCTI